MHRKRRNAAILSDGSDHDDLPPFLPCTSVIYGVLPSLRLPHSPKVTGLCGPFMPTSDCSEGTNVILGIFWQFVSE